MTSPVPTGPTPTTVLPAGADLRMTWPERQLAIRRMEYRRGLYKLADTELPFLPDFIARVGGAMPLTLGALNETEYSRRMETFWSQQANRGMDRDVAELMLNAGIRYAYAVEWWEYEGRRAYLLDPTTAHALMHTSIDDFPVSEVRFPVRSFFIRFPQELGWSLSMDRPDVNLSRPRHLHPELEQPLDGVHLTVDGPTERPTRVQVIIAGRSQRDLAGDHCMWSELPLFRHDGVSINTGEGLRKVGPPCDGVTLGQIIDSGIQVGRVTTVGDVVNNRLLPNDKWAALADVDRKILRMAFGALLYITSSHPNLRPIDPPAESTLKRQERTGNPEQRARAKNRSRYSITYVGGPTSGFRAARAPSGEPSDMTRQPPRPHVRVGHFRHVWLGPRDGERRSEVRWIQPVTVGTWDRVAAWRAEQGYKMVIGKTRPAEIAPGRGMT